MNRDLLKQMVEEDKPENGGLGLLQMYTIYGKKKIDDKYLPVNLITMEFVKNRIKASMIDSWEKADRICHDLEEQNPDMLFEAREF
jgi:hypothetical protein